MIGTHLHKLLRQRAFLLLSQDDANALIDQLTARHPQLGASISPRVLPLATTTRLLADLLEEGVSLRDFTSIAGALASAIQRSQDPSAILELVRGQIGGIITASFAPGAGALRLIALAPPLEALLVAAHRAAPEAPWPFEPQLAGQLTDAVARVLAGPLAAAGPLALVSPPGPRRALWRLLRGSAGALPVIGFTELPDSRPVEVVAVVGNGGEEPEPGVDDTARAADADTVMPDGLQERP